MSSFLAYANVWLALSHPGHVHYRAASHWFYESEETVHFCRELTRTGNHSPNAWSDAYLGALARSLGLRIVSFDRVFRTMPGVEATVL